MKSSPFERRLDKRNIGHGGREAEKKIAKRIGGRLQPASGAMEGAKGDITKGDFLIEAKSTVNDSLSLKKDWMLKIYQEGLEQGKKPAVAINFTSPSGASEKRERWVAVPEHIFMEMIGE